jgi:probable rRNA maturation factor
MHISVDDADGPHVYVRRKGKGPKQTVQLERAVLHTLSAVAPQVRGDVTLVLTGDAAVRALNKRYRGRDHATDVLAFPLSDGAAKGEPFGDIVISVDTAQRQAREYGASAREELQRLIVHGTLHLCGYDHHERREAARMHALTRRMLKELDRA